MKFNSNYSFDFGSNNKLYLDLLSEEDFDFKTKDINIEVSENNNKVEVSLICDSVLDLKIGTNALIKSLEVITKTLEV